MIILNLDGSTNYTIDERMSENEKLILEHIVTMYSYLFNQPGKKGIEQTYLQLAELMKNYYDHSTVTYFANLLVHWYSKYFKE